MKNKSAFILCSFCLFLSMTACDQKKQEKKHTVTSSTVTEKKKNETIDGSLFSQINEGMTYNEVKELIGIEGDLLIDEGDKDSANHKQTFAWKGSAPKSFAEITFLDGKVRSKLQQGLI
ncbi:hypothetical protein CON65_23550 [Bacillus pseudomycoides]|uniref:DUF3862 domain-containing protein n=1 Tax=Bacillus pseudomycoides TaxID=64104 RepID=A0AA91V8M2_9BACI|nr:MULTISPECIES: hypothetical protein [Bacillus]PEB47757.1 hypothetical protein COO03_25310 [Bacillus sp. AFS098217]PED80254.1 hypothetical protein CON65_23550 [Bacillus pseudomycoides]PEU11697.1 hypothetical protein CN524_14350 [Bacillus sp. AFS019443]PEU17902.1 hypothetical protein CN525_13570 [Bacillus sp. AFS014408]PFW62576.1 hypothetical protein COL20_12290 [Bacillus sp. AFS075034]